MTTNDSTVPEIMQNAEFVYIQFPSEKTRALRVLKKAALAAAGTCVAMIVVIAVSNHVDNKIPAED